MILVGLVPPFFIKNGREKKNFLKSLGLQDEVESEGEIDSKDIYNTKKVYTSKGR